MRTMMLMMLMMVLMMMLMVRMDGHNVDEQAYVSRQVHLFTRVGAFPAKRSSLDLLQI